MDFSGFESKKCFQVSAARTLIVLQQDITNNDLTTSKRLQQDEDKANKSDLHKILTTYFNFAYCFFVSPIRFVQAQNSNGREYILKSYFLHTAST